MPDDIEPGAVGPFPEPVGPQASAHQISIRDLPGVAVAGARDIVVIILALAGFFDAISGNPIHGIVLGSAGAVLAVDAYVGGLDGLSEPPVVARSDSVLPGLLVTSVVAAIFAIVVGGFTRYSWPATMAAVVPGA